MHGTHARSMYTGYAAAAPIGYGTHHQHGVPGHGFCAGCCHPRSACCCVCRECRKEARDLLVEPTTKRGDVKRDPTLAHAASRMSVLRAFAVSMEEGRPQEEEEVAADERAVPSQWLTAEALRSGRLGLGTAFIGGGCCVHLSIEYTPTGAADGIVGVHVQDSYDTQLTWIKKAAAGLGYQIKEGIVTTKPGAHLTALAVGATARVRWCEVFSC
jgi:hypothetical protein